MTITAEAAKWWQTIKVTWSKHMAYKVNFVLTVLAPAAVFFFIKYNLWSAIFSMKPGGEIAGYTLDSMINYQLWVLVIALVGTGSNSMALAEDIRLGRISSYMIYPFKFWQFHFASFLSFQMQQIVVALFTVSLVVSIGFLSAFDPVFFIKGFSIALLVGSLWFALQFLIGIFAFWMEETWVLRVILIQLSAFLSGAIIPLEIYPKWFVSLLYYTPFPYLTYVPAKIFMGEYQGSVLTAAAVSVGWLGAILIANSFVWKRGVKLYTAAGM